MDFTQHFNNAEFADVCIKLTTASREGRHRSRQQDLLLHSLMLKMGSPYFLARLSDKWREPPQKKGKVTTRQSAEVSASSSEGVLLELVEHVDSEDDMDAAVKVLQFLYSGKLEYATPASPLQLLSAFLVASRFQVQRCVEACAAALGAMRAMQWNEAAVSLLLDLPQEVLCNLSSWEAVHKTARKQLVNLYGNVPCILVDSGSSEGKLQRFLNLPHAVVLAWLQEDSHVVHSEDCMLALLTAWVEGKQGQQCSIEQLTQLAKGLRLINLSSSGMTSLLPFTEWFNRVLAADASLRVALRSVQIRKCMVQHGIERQRPKWHISGPRAGGSSIPQKWTAKARARTHEPWHVMTWVLDEAELQQLYQGQQVASARRIYCSGFWFSLVAQKADVSPADELSGGGEHTSSASDEADDELDEEEEEEEEMDASSDGDGDSEEVDDLGDGSEEELGFSSEGSEEEELEGDDAPIHRRAVDNEENVEQRRNGLLGKVGLYLGLVAHASRVETPSAHLPAVIFSAKAQKMLGHGVCTRWDHMEDLVSENGLGDGAMHLVGQRGATLAEALQQYLWNGKLWLKVSITAVL